MLGQRLRRSTNGLDFAGPDSWIFDVKGGGVARTFFDAVFYFADSLQPPCSLLAASLQPPLQIKPSLEGARQSGKGGLGIPSTPCPCALPGGEERSLDQPMQLQGPIHLAHLLIPSSYPSPILLQPFSDPPPVLLQSSNPPPILLQCSSNAPPMLLQLSSNHRISIKHLSKIYRKSIEDVMGFSKIFQMRKSTRI